MKLPLFPLSSIVLPDGLLPLRLFEPRYINMIKECFKNETGFGVCLIKEGNEVGAPSVPYEQGTLVSIVDFDQGSDGLLHITAKGVQEFDLLSYSVQKDQLLVGEVSLREPDAPLVMNDKYRELSNKLGVILSYVEPNIVYDDKRLDEPDWVCHRLLELLPITSASKYELLQLPDNATRLDALSGLQIEFATESDD
jgi:Lon protease-like protein